MIVYNKFICTVCIFKRIIPLFIVKPFGDEDGQRLVVFDNTCVRLA